VADVLLDLGTGDVHVPGGAAPEPAKAPKVEMISAAKRKSLPSGKFALPAQKKYPLDTAARVRNAAARLAQQKKRGKISDADYNKARRAIVSAGKKYGIKSELKLDVSDAEKRKVGEAPGQPRTEPPKVHVHGQLGPGGSIHIRHLSDGTTQVYLPACLLTEE
jgi:hypothetical protein